MECYWVFWNKKPRKHSNDKRASIICSFNRKTRIWIVLFRRNVEKSKWLRFWIFKRVDWFTLTCTGSVANIKLWDSAEYIILQFYVNTRFDIITKIKLSRNYGMFQKYVLGELIYLKLTHQGVVTIRFLCLPVCRFKSCHPHQTTKGINTKQYWYPLFLYSANEHLVFNYV